MTTILQRLTMLALFFALSVITLSACANEALKSVENTLDNFHKSASQADGKTYFNLFADKGIFIGTDASERWTVAAFKDYAQPYFEQGKGWTYTPTERHVQFINDNVAWFDELLWNDKYGLCRGTGLLVLANSEWKIQQYHLSFPIPNELAAGITQSIKQHNKQEQ